jgi:hypothetical protein
VSATKAREPTTASQEEMGGKDLRTDFPDLEATDCVDHLAGTEKQAVSDTKAL